MEDGESGYLVDSTEECTEKVLFLLENPQEARRIGANAHKFVRDNNLMPRLIAQEMELLNSL
jgi:trehalose synthase